LGQLIEDHEAGPVYQREHEEQPLALAAAERCERRASPLGQPELFEQLVPVATAEQVDGLADAQPVGQGRAL
jgi:hypothetical protein